MYMYNASSTFMDTTSCNVQMFTITSLLLKKRAFKSCWSRVQSCEELVGYSICCIVQTACCLMSAKNIADSTTMVWMQRTLSFALLRHAVLCMVVTQYSIVPQMPTVTWAWQKSPFLLTIFPVFHQLYEIL